MKAQTKALLASIVVIALALTAVSGVTYSWFSDTEKAEIDVTIGAVDIELSDVTLKTYSYVDGSCVLQAEKGEGDVAGFYNSPAGKGALLNKDTSGKWNLTVESIADGDYVEIYGDIINKSTIKTIYRTTIKEINGPTTLFEALVAGTSTSTSWAPADAASGASGDLIADHKLLAKIGLDSYAGADTSCKIELSIEAYQSNADVDKTIDQTTVKGENTIAMDSTDSSSKLKSATVTVVDPDGGKKIQLSEVASSTYSSYSISGILAGIDLTSSAVSDLYKNCKATIVMVLDGTYAEGELTVYHGDSVMPSTTGSQNNIVTVSSDATAGTTTVTIVTYDGFSPYLISQKAVKGTNASGEAFYDSIKAATEAGCTELTILRDYDGANKGLDSGKDEVAVISNAMIVTSVEGAVVKNVNFEINVVSPGKDDVVILKNLHLETDSAHQQVEHMITLASTNACAVEISGIEFITGCRYSTNHGFAAIWSDGAGKSDSLTIKSSTFRIADSINLDQKLHAIQVNGASKLIMEGNKFIGISRPINIDGIMCVESSDNVFSMPTGSADTYLKVYSINNDIEEFTISGDDIQWKNVSGVLQYPVFINSDLVMKGLFNSDHDVHIADAKKFTVAGIADIGGSLTFGTGAYLVLGTTDSPAGSVTVTKELSVDPGVTMDYSLVKSKTESGSFSYSSLRTLAEGENLQTVVKDTNAKGTIGIRLSDGTYTFTEAPAQDVIISGNGSNTIVDMTNTTMGAHGKNIVFENVTVKMGTADYHGIQHSNSVTYRNCTLEGVHFLYAENVIFENCNFVNHERNEKNELCYNIWTYGAGTVDFINCSFECDGKAVLIYNEGKITTQTVNFKDCTFNALQFASGKAAIEIDCRFTSYTVNVNNCSQTGFDYGSKSGNQLWNVKDGDKPVTITVNGTEVYPTA